MQLPGKGVQMNVYNIWPSLFSFPVISNWVYYNDIIISQLTTEVLDGLDALLDFLEST